MANVAVRDNVPTLTYDQIMSGLLNARTVGEVRYYEELLLANRWKAGIVVRHVGKKRNRTKKLSHRILKAWKK